MQMELLQEEVLKHRDTVAALSGTIAQYKALAESAEEAHKGTQVRTEATHAGLCVRMGVSMLLLTVF